MSIPGAAPRCQLLVLLAAFPLTLFAFRSGPIPHSEAGPGGSPLACTQCHSGSGLNTGGGSVELQFPNGLTYVPGQKQRLRIVVTDATALVFGFQVSARLTSNELSGQAGSFTILGSSQQVLCEDGLLRPVSGQCSPSAPLEFIEHSAPSNTNTIEFDWTPPSGSPGNIRFYVAANAANNNFVNTGDHIYAANYTLIPQAPASQTPSLTSLNPVHAAGSSLTRTFVFTDSDGAADIHIVNVLVNFYLDGRNACYIAYDNVQNVMYLTQDDGQVIIGLALPSAGTLSNSQCAVPASSVVATKSGNTLTLTLTFTFKPGFDGTRVVFAAARDKGLRNSGWIPAGQHTISTTATNPLPTGVTPPSGSATIDQTYSLSASYRDATAASNLQPVQILINDALDGRNACYLGFDHGGNVLYLVNNDGNALLPTAIRLNGASGGSASMENTQCRVLAAGSTYSDSNQTLTMSVRIQFKAAFAGRRLIYAGAQTTTGANSGWTVLGALTVQ